MILEDFVMLGTTVPEPRRDGRVFVCSAGYSPELGQLIRIYPLARRKVPNRWGMYQVRLERNPEDSRRESWKLAGNRAPSSHWRINEAFRKIDTVRRRHGLLDSVVVESIAEANAKRLSLAILYPEATPELTFEHNPDSPDSPHLRLFEVGERPESGSKRFAYIPRLSFRDAGGGHNLMLRDWGCFEFMRKYGDNRRDQLNDTLRLNRRSALLVGNLANQRNAWLIISVLNGLRDAQASLFEVA